jgi:hypothetical protein
LIPRSEPKNENLHRNPDLLRNRPDFRGSVRTLTLNPTRNGPFLMNPNAYRAAINRAIAHTGLIIYAGPGYSYFKDAAGDQIGESIMVYRQSDLSIDQWISEAEYAAKVGAR